MRLGEQQGPVELLLLLLLVWHWLPPKPTLQEQVLGAVQFPWPEHTVESVDCLVKQMGDWHWLPPKPALQEQLLVAMQFPWPEHTVGSVDSLVKQVKLVELLLLLLQDPQLLMLQLVTVPPFWKETAPFWAIALPVIVAPVEKETL
jgi:hypothetical protein